MKSTEEELDRLNTQMQQMNSRKTQLEFQLINEFDISEIYEAEPEKAKDIWKQKTTDKKEKLINEYIHDDILIGWLIEIEPYTKELICNEMIKYKDKSENKWCSIPDISSDTILEFIDKYDIDIDYQLLSLIIFHRQEDLDFIKNIVKRFNKEWNLRKACIILATARQTLNQELTDYLFSNTKIIGSMGENFRLIFNEMYELLYAEPESRRNCCWDDIIFEGSGYFNGEFKM